MTNEAIEKARKLRDGGKTYQAIANALGVASMTIYYNLNPAYMERKRCYGKQYHANHKEERCAYNRWYHTEHKEEISAYAKRYYASHKEEINACRRQYYIDHKEKERACDRQYYIDHKEKRIVYSKQFKQKHKAGGTAYSAKRRSLIAGATMGDIDQIKEIYRIAQEEPKVRCFLCKKLIPIGHRHVDHIYPLSKDGSHTRVNLEVLCDKCNEKKAAKIPEEIGLLL